MGTEDIGDEITRPLDSRRRMRWLRIMLGGTAAEVGLFIIAVVFYFLPNGNAALLYVVPIACFCVTLLLGFWVAQKAQSLLVLHGALVGTVAALIYIALTWGRTLPTAYIVSHFLKVIGGASGGFIASRRRSEK
jgi:putative membrane protein (TIGR04086 family)